MKAKKMNSLAKKVSTGILIVAVVLAGVFVSPVTSGEAEAAVPQAVEYVKMTDFSKTPTKDGYLFGGWYDADGGNSLESVSGRSEAWAKFVPAYVLSIKAQNLYTTARNNGSALTSARFVTAVDCADYQEVGFTVIANNKERKYEIDTVYEYLYEKERNQASNSSRKGTQLFGAGATYIAAVSLNKIPEASWSDNLYVRPYWITADGTTVEGLGKYVRIDDGLDGYISVPVNLTTAEQIAAGIVHVTYETDKVKYVSDANGRVFDEMLAAEKTAGIVKCVGNVTDVSSNKTADDIYISLRFEVLDGYDVANGEFATFTMSKVDFCDKEETTTTTTVWDVQY